MGPHPRAARRVARDRARPQHAAAGPAPAADRPVRRDACPQMPRLCRRASRRSAPPRSSWARRWRRGPIWSAKRRSAQSAAVAGCAAAGAICRDPPRDRNQLRPAARAIVRLRSTRCRSARRRSRRSTARSRPRAAGRDQGAAPRRARRNSRARSTLMNGPRRSLRRWAARRRRLRPRLVIARLSSAGRCANSICGARPPRRPNWPRRSAAEPGYLIPAIDWQRTSGRVMTLEWIDGIKISDRDAADRRWPRPARHRPASWSSLSCARRFAKAIFHADMHQGNLFVEAGRHDRRDRFRHHGPDRPPRAGLAGAKSSTG